MSEEFDLDPMPDPRIVGSDYGGVPASMMSSKDIRCRLWFPWFKDRRLSGVLVEELYVIEPGIDHPNLPEMKARRGLL